MLTCAPAAVVPLNRCDPTPAKMYQTSALPSVGPTLFNDGHEAILHQSILVQDWRRSSAIGRLADELEDGRGSPVPQHSGRFSVLPADIRPPDEIVTILANKCHRHSELPPDFRAFATTKKVLVGVRGSQRRDGNAGSLRVHHLTRLSRIRAGDRIECRRRGGVTAPDEPLPSSTVSTPWLKQFIARPRASCGRRH